MYTSHLHSNLVIFKLTPVTQIFHLFLIFTFQSGDIQIFQAVLQAHQHFLFTFQSGDIQIIASAKIVANVELFTFQSGDIQIDFVIEWLNKAGINLHTNLVIFKSYCTHSNTIKIIKFTFQSGDIQISNSTSKY